MDKAINGMPELALVGTRIVDAAGRTVILRGVNLGGDSKVPYPSGGTHHPTDFSDHRSVSFIGRPFPLAEADEHFTRLRHWGFNCLRLITTWEAIEHAGPGQYDAAYLDFYAELCERAGQYGLYVVVDFHQDVWSRMSGGDGAPGWIFEHLGIDISKLDEADAAFTMQRRFDYNDPRPRQPERYPQMSWFSNYVRAANGILWTLFFGGHDFAPQLSLEGQNVQDFLQTHLSNAQVALAKRIAHLPNVIGFDLINEPSPGWIGKSLSWRPVVKKEGEDPVFPGIAWSPLDALCAARGMTLHLPHMALSRRRMRIVQQGEKVVNPHGVSIWQPGHQDPFETAGVYRIDAQGRPEALKENHFREVRGRRVNFINDYLKPFQLRCAAALHAVKPSWMILLEANPMNASLDDCFRGELPAHAVNGGHWYDATTLLLKRFLHPVGFNLVHGRLILGHNQRRQDYKTQLAELMGHAQKADLPTIVGEFGIPFDLSHGKAYQEDAMGDHSERPWRKHIMALEIMYEGMDDLLLSCIQWNYTASNHNDLRIGDGWNQEDLSIFSRDQQHDPHDIDSGGRALSGFVRPYARHVQGVPTRMHFARETGLFELEFYANPTLTAPTEIFVPKRQFPRGFAVDAPYLDREQGEDAQLLQFWARRSGPLRIRLKAL